MSTEVVSFSTDECTWLNLQSSGLRAYGVNDVAEISVSKPLLTEVKKKIRSRVATIIVNNPVCMITFGCVSPS